MAKSQVIQFRVPLDVYASIELKAKAAGISPGEWARIQTLENVTTPVYKPVSQTAVALKRTPVIVEGGPYVVVHKAEPRLAPDPPREPMPTFRGKCTGNDFKCECQEHKKYRASLGMAR